jgi:hypothetical protein
MVNSSQAEIARKRIPDSVVRIELISHFHRNPAWEGTCHQLARTMGREIEQVERQMRKLVELNIVQEIVIGGENRFRYVPPFSISLRERGRKRRNTVPFNVNGGGTWGEVGKELP